LVIELDGYAWHGDRRAFEEDRARDNALQALGWRVVRITWAKLRFDPDGVEALLRTYLNLAPVPSAY
jgi:very-short-patch-repair endonuclease